MDGIITIEFVFVLASASVFVSDFASSVFDLSASSVLFSVVSVFVSSAFFSFCLTIAGAGPTG